MKVKIVEFKINPIPTENIRLFGMGDDGKMYWWNWNTGSWEFCKNKEETK